MSNLLMNSDVVWDAFRTRPIKARGEFAMAAAPTTLDAVKKFLSDHQPDLMIPFGVDGLKLAHTAETPVRKVFRFDHTLDGIPVFGAQLLVQTDPQERVRHLEFYAGPTNILAPPAGAQRLGADQALKIVHDLLGSFTRRLDTPAPDEVWFPTERGLARAFRVLIATAAPPHDWQIMVDAYTGRVLDQRDLIKETPYDGNGLVFDPNPVVTAMDNTLRDPSATTGTCGFSGSAQAIIDSQRINVTLRDLAMNPGGEYTLDGPYCRIHDFGAPASAFPAETSGIFAYPSNDDRFEAVMVYYHIDTFQRYLKSIGITNAHPTVIECDPHDNSVNAAWFSPFDKGLHFSDSGMCHPDRAEDAECMIHEYGHAIQEYQVPGWAGSNNPITLRNEAGAMGEGFGDFLACVNFAERGGGFQREIFEDWVFGPSGLRRVDGVKLYPTNWAYEVHADGEIWSAALWNIFRSIGGDSIFKIIRDGAREAMFRSVINSHPLLATNASMPDGAEAIMTTNAELPEYRGLHLMHMLDSFHDRGILHVDAKADLYIRDDLADPGTESYHSPAFWDSADVWVRNSDDNGTTPESPKAGQDNWFYARVWNRGPVAARAFVVTFNVKLWLGTQFIYPSDFIEPFISAAPGFNLAPGASKIVKAKWPAALVPPAGSHGCMLVSAYTPTETVPAGTHVWDHGNLAQKNLTIAKAGPKDSLLFQFRAGHRGSAQPQVFRLEVRKPVAELQVSLLADPRILKSLYTEPIPIERPPRATAASVPPTITIVEPTRLELTYPQMEIPVSLSLESGSRISLGRTAAPPLAASRNFLKPDFEAVSDGSNDVSELRFLPGRAVGLPIYLRARSDLHFTLKVQVPAQARRGDSYVIDVVQRDQEDRTIGGIRFKIIVE